MLIDHYLPRFDVTRIEHTVVDADVATTWSALRRLDLMRVHTPLMDAAMVARGLPARVSSRLGHQAPPPPQPARLLLTDPSPHSRAGCRWANAPRARSPWAQSAGSGDPTSSGTTFRP